MRFNIVTFNEYIKKKHIFFRLSSESRSQSGLLLGIHVINIDELNPSGDICNDEVDVEQSRV